MSKVLIIQGDARSQGTMKRMAVEYAQVMAEQHEIRVVDLASLDYDIALSEGYQTKRTPEMLAISEFAKEADLLAFFYPIWFANIPASLKGFIENLFWVKETYSFKEKEYLWNGKWRGKKASVFYSIGGREVYHKLFGRAGYKAVRQPLWLSGIFDIQLSVFEKRDRSTRRPEDEIRQKVLKKAAADLKRLAK
ncbi:hypothetical protein IGI37_002424 [Enterococcus sp. AZ194]|uniref:NAD(P)H-dependent oxidoreductase n=1 Tax=Enterococcus sp. AZ194 TaxID=2774629 RepID=UPI003F1E822D